ncbi:MAG: bacterioferritin, partial [Candidatus Hydrothermarchaeota archaeon]
MWQHIMAPGIKGKIISADLRAIAIEEMLHAEQIAERLHYLGGTPIVKPDPVNIGENLKEMVELDVKAELEAIKMYKNIIAIAEKRTGFYYS